MWRSANPRVSACGQLLRAGLGAAWLVVTAPAVAADGLKVETARSGSAVAVSAVASIHAPQELIWQTLTDYEHLAEFIPGISRSRVVGRRGPAAIVEQNGQAGILFFSYPVKVVVESAEYPPHTITIRVLSGNLKQLDGRYLLERGGGEGDFVLRWRGIIEPEVPLPAFITVPLMRANIEDQFTGMVREIERRNLQRRLKEAGRHAVP
jgi:hypothetical protein